MRKAASGPEYDELVEVAGRAALADAGLAFDTVEAAVCGFCYGEPSSGHRGVHRLGRTGIPIFNVRVNHSIAVRDEVFAAVGA